MKKKFDNLYVESKHLHKEINNLVKTLLVKYEDEMDDLDVEDATLLLKLSSITKRYLDLTDNCCKKLDDIDKKLDDIIKKLDNN